MHKTDFTHEDVTQILRLVDSLPDGEVRIELGDLKLHVRKGEPGAPPGPAASGPLAAPTQAPPAPTTNALPSLLPASTGSSASGTVGETLAEGLVAVRAPMLGRFYRAASPGDPPLVDVGERVSASDPVCLIEVMKLFTTINAGIAGTIVEIRATNNSLVEFDQILLTIRPE